MENIPIQVVYNVVGELFIQNKFLGERLAQLTKELADARAQKEKAQLEVLELRSQAE